MVKLQTESVFFRMVICFNFIGHFVLPKLEVILTAEEESKAQVRDQEQNRLRMHQVREAQRTEKNDCNVLIKIEFIPIQCYIFDRVQSTQKEGYQGNNIPNNYFQMLSP